jgi:uncharacterized membrane protein
MRIAESAVTYVAGLTALALIVRYSDNVNGIIKSTFGGVSDFATTLINPMAARIGR